MKHSGRFTTAKTLALLATFPAAALSLAQMSFGSHLTFANVNRRAHSNEEHYGTEKNIRRRSPIKYDLGLGKNKQVVSRVVGVKAAPEDSHAPEDVQTTSQFWMPDDSAIDTAATTAEAEEQPISTNEKNHPKKEQSAKKSPRLKRAADDVIIVLTDSSEDVPPHFVVASRSDLADVNTVWLEMLIHHQQQLLQEQIVAL